MYATDASGGRRCPEYPAACLRSRSPIHDSTVLVSRGPRGPRAYPEPAGCPDLHAAARATQRSYGPLLGCLDEDQPAVRPVELGCPGPVFFVCQQKAQTALSAFVGRYGMRNDVVIKVREFLKA